MYRYTHLTNSPYSLTTGVHILPVNLLLEPPSSLPLRDTNEQFIATLKKEMLDNPKSDVQPIFCIVKLDEGQAFHLNLKEGYTYKMIGRNHS